MSNVRRFGAAGDGVADDTQAIQHAVDDGDGMLHFPPGTYRISRSIEVQLEKSGPVAVDGTGGTARLLMAGPGPALRIAGTHEGTGDPFSVKGSVFPDQRLPTIKHLEIEGSHESADGIELVQTMQPLIEGIAVRGCRHGIHLVKRNRNVLISNCHIYHNSGVGIYLDHVNLHQINIATSHISYNRLGGIRIVGSEIRNLQITGNDIEYNNHAKHEAEPEPVAEIYVDVTSAGATVNELTISSNTIQATPSPGGANLCLLEDGQSPDRPPGLWSVTGNVIGNQENNVHLRGCYGVALTGNCIYSCGHRNLLIEDSRQITIGGNVFRRHTPNLATGVRVVRSSDLIFQGNSIVDEDPVGQTTMASLLEMAGCRRVTVTGCQFIGGVPAGVDAVDCRDTSIVACAIHDARAEVRSRHAVRFGGEGSGNLVSMNSIGPVLATPIAVADEAGVTVRENVFAEQEPRPEAPRRR